MQNFPTTKKWCPIFDEKLLAKSKSVRKKNESEKKFILEFFFSQGMSHKKNNESEKSCSTIYFFVQ